MVPDAAMNVKHNAKLGYANLDREMLNLKDESRKRTSRSQFYLSSFYRKGYLQYVSTHM
jgi:hypothetical protein